MLPAEDRQDQVLSDSGAECGNCGAWRRLVDDYFLEKCRGCGDEEEYIFSNDEDEIPTSFDDGDT